MKHYEILTDEGFKDFQGVKRSKSKIYKISFDNGTYLECTYGHTLFSAIDNSKVTLEDLAIGDFVLGKDSNILQVENIEDLGIEDYVYDVIRVDNEKHSYYTNEVLSKNCAFIDNWESFSNSTIPTISSSKTSQIIATSTPMGLNHWYTMWQNAVEGKSSYKAVKVEWWEVEGRTKEFKELMIKTLEGGIVTWMQEYECEFMGSANTLIDMKKLSMMKEGETISEPHFGENVRVYEAPIEKHSYVMCADGSKGGGDSFAFHIIDVTKMPFKQVVAGQIKGSYLIAPQMLYNILRSYNYAFLIGENNDGGGQSTLDILFQVYEYENIYQDEGKDYLGTRTTKSTRPKNLSNLKLFLENNKLILQDAPTIGEFMTFVNKNGKYQAQDSKSHDDLVMALSVLFAPISNNINNIIDYDMLVNKFQNPEDSEEDEETSKILSLGFFDDGTTSEEQNKPVYWNVEDYM